MCPTISFMNFDVPVRALVGDVRVVLDMGPIIKTTGGNGNNEHSETFEKCSILV